MSVAEGVVDRLARDGADLGPHDLLDVVGGAVRPVGHRPQDGQALGRDLQPVLAEQRSFVRGGSVDMSSAYREDWTMSRTFSDPDPVS